MMSETPIKSPTSNKVFLENLQSVMKRRNNGNEAIPASRPMTMVIETATSSNQGLVSESGNNNNLWDGDATKHLLDTKALQHRITVAKCRSHRRPTTAHNEANNSSSSVLLAEIAEENISFERKSLSTENETKEEIDKISNNPATKQEENIISRKLKSPVHLKRHADMVNKRPVSLFAAKPTPFQLKHNENDSSLNKPPIASLEKQNSSDSSAVETLTTENQTSPSVAEIRRLLGGSNNSGSASVSDNCNPVILTRTASINNESPIISTSSVTNESLAVSVSNNNHQTNSATKNLLSTAATSENDEKPRKKSVFELLQEFENRKLNS